MNTKRIPPPRRVSIARPPVNQPSPAAAPRFSWPRPFSVLVGWGAMVLVVVEWGAYSEGFVGIDQFRVWCVVTLTVVIVNAVLTFANWIMLRRKKVRR